MIDIVGPVALLAGGRGVHRGADQHGLAGVSAANGAAFGDDITAPTRTPPSSGSSLAHFDARLERAASRCTAFRGTGRAARHDLEMSLARPTTSLAHVFIPRSRVMNTENPRSPQ
jgi:hypothetical protein